MKSRFSVLSLFALITLALSSCSADTTARGTEGMIELAVSETCIEKSDPRCVSVSNENVMLPAAFEQARVGEAAVVDGGEQNTVDVTFTKDGAKVFHSLTEKAAQAGDTSRLVVKIGQEIQAVVMVMEALEGDSVQMSLSSNENAQDIVDLIWEG